MPLTETPDRAHYAAAVSVANIPTLLMVLTQMTGDQRWLRAPFRPSRGTGMGDNDLAGLPEYIQDEIRAAALEAILEWRAGKPLAIPQPSHALLVEMLSVAMGEHVPPEYGEFTEALLGEHPVPNVPISMPAGFRVLIIGAGVSGICAAVHLRAAGIPFTILEKNDTVGGVWLENRYPGAGVDTPNHLYSFSFAMHDWSKFFALRDDLHGYLEHVAKQFDLHQHIRFNSKVERAAYDNKTQTWAVTVAAKDGTHHTLNANVVISAVGIFNPPVWPKIEGLREFAGKTFHTAEWPADADLTDQRVAIIGNGASCMQTAPEIQHKVKSLTIYQRSPQWASPFDQFRREVPEALRYLLKTVPLYQAWYRTRLAWTFNDRLHSVLQKDPNWKHSERSLNATNDAHRAYFTQYIKEELGERQDLFDKVVPSYPPFGKRMLLDNGWFRMLRNPKVELVTETVKRIEGNCVVAADGIAREADVLVIATGFDVLRFISTYEVLGRSGQSLRDAWEDDNAKAYLGTVVPDFPNFYMLYGPNLQPGHGGSIIAVVEMQVNYIMDILRKMSAQHLGAVECRRDAYDRYIAGVDAAHVNMVWSHEGMTTYYRNRRGRITVNSPYRNVDFFKMTREVKLEDYLVEARRA